MSIQAISPQANGLQCVGADSMTGLSGGRRCGDRRGSVGWASLLLTLALLLPSGVVQSESASSLAGDRLSRLVQLVAESGENSLQDFSWIALSELIAAYENVYLSSTSEVPKEKKARDKLISWRNGTQRYISQLHALLDRLPGLVELRIQAGEAGPPVITIDGEPVVISGPEIGRVMLMEKRIVDTYCAMYDCGELFASAGQQSVTTAAGRGIWVLKNHGRASYATPDGLIFTFSGISGRKEKQQICEALAVDIRSLAAGLRDAIDAGYPVDWDRLEIQPLAGSADHRILFNSAGEYLRMMLPGLAQLGAAPSSGILAWIKQTVIEETPSEVEIFADRLLLGGSGIETE